MDHQKLKRADSIRKAIRHIWKKRVSTFRTKRKRGEPDKIPSFGTQPLSGSDDAASHAPQDNDFEAPQATQSAVLFPFPD
jgi:hypothetical protein